MPIDKSTDVTKSHKQVNYKRFHLLKLLNKTLQDPERNDESSLHVVHSAPMLIESCNMFDVSFVASC